MEFKTNTLKLDTTINPMTTIGKIKLVQILAIM